MIFLLENIPVIFLCSIFGIVYMYCGDNVILEGNSVILVKNSVIIV